MGTFRRTQITVCPAEVRRKRDDWSALGRSQRKARIREELFPVVKGSADALYILDRHHAALALLQGDVSKVQAGLVRDLSDFGEVAFWTFLEHLSWMHAYDARGPKHGLKHIPNRRQDLHGDPFHSFAGDVLDAGGFAEPDEPLQEFRWPNFRRAAFTAKAIQHDCAKPLHKALKLALSPDAKHLPGSSGAK